MSDTESPQWNSIRWIVFDAVGTIIYPVPNIIEVYHQAAVHYGSKLSSDEIGRRFSISFAQLEHAIPNSYVGPICSDDPYQTNEEMEDARWREIVGEVVADVECIDECYQYLSHHFAQPEHWSCFPDVSTTTQSLSEMEIRVAIASNFDRRLHAICDGHEELKAFERRLISSELGTRKPGLGFYRRVIEQLDCPAGQILMVGDSLDNDVQPARQVGMHAVELVRGNSNDNRATAKMQISSLIELRDFSRRAL